MYARSLDSSLNAQAVKAGVGAVPNMAAILPAEAGDDSDDKLELQGQGTISLKCPLLFTDFVKPMRKYVHCFVGRLLRSAVRQALRGYARTDYRN